MFLNFPSPLPQKLSVDYSDFKPLDESQISEAGGYSVYEAKLQATDEVHHIRILNLKDHQQDRNKATTIFIREALRLCSLYSDCIILDSLEVKDDHIWYATQPMTNPVSISTESSSKLDISRILTHLLTDLKHLSRIDGDLDFQNAKICRFQAQKNDEEYYFLQDWNKILKRPREEQINDASRLNVPDTEKNNLLRLANWLKSLGLVPKSEKSNPFGYAIFSRIFVSDANTKEILNEIKENEMKNKEMKENEMKENEMKKKEIKENEMKENEMKENEIKMNEMKKKNRKGKSCCIPFVIGVLFTFVSLAVLGNLFESDIHAFYQQILKESQTQEMRKLVINNNDLLLGLSGKTLALRNVATGDLLSTCINKKSSDPTLEFACSVDGFEWGVEGWVISGSPGKYVLNSNRFTGNVLDSTGFFKNSNGPIHQQWKISSTGSGTVTLQNVATGKFLFGTKNGHLKFIGREDGNPYQEWVLYGSDQ